MKSPESKAWQRFLIMEAKNPETVDADEFNEAEADAEATKKSEEEKKEEVKEDSPKTGKNGMTLGEFIKELNKHDKDAIVQFADNEQDQLLNYVKDINDKALDGHGNKACMINLEWYDFFLENEKKKATCCEAKEISQEDLIDGLTNFQAEFESASHGNKDTHKRIMDLFDDLIGEIETYGGLN